MDALVKAIERRLEGVERALPKSTPFELRGYLFQALFDLDAMLTQYRELMEQSEALIINLCERLSQSERENEILTHKVRELEDLVAIHNQRVEVFRIIGGITNAH